METENCRQTSDCPCLPKLVVGLGNPGREYDGTRHNAGFLAADAFLAACENFTLAERQPLEGFLFRATLEGKPIHVLKPTTYMNRSGFAVSEALQQLRISPREVLVACDDLDMAAGRLRLRAKGSCGGHKGLISIAESLGTLEFPRLRLGIGRPRPEVQNVTDYVLAQWTSDEFFSVSQVLEMAANILQTSVMEGVKPNSWNLTVKSSDKFNAEKGETEIEKVRSSCNS